MLELSAKLPGAKNFYVHEAACGCGCGFGRHEGDVSPALIVLLEAVREEVGHPLFVNSWCRCHAHNRAEGGVDGSVHCLGEAADLKAIGGERKHGIEKAGYAHGATGVGTGENFIHLDVHDGRVKYRPSSWGY
jgi:uncharacterized protein YcbK (DUF882 family)